MKFIHNTNARNWEGRQKTLRFPSGDDLCCSLSSDYFWQEADEARAGLGMKAEQLPGAVISQKACGVWAGGCRARGALLTPGQHLQEPEPSQAQILQLILGGAWAPHLGLSSHSTPWTGCTGLGGFGAGNTTLSLHVALIPSLPRASKHAGM